MPKKSSPANRAAEVKASAPESDPDWGATADDVNTEGYGWTKGEAPPEPVRYDSAFVERAHVDGEDYYRIVKTTAGSFTYDSEW